jgi:hypothetical protein
MGRLVGYGVQIRPDPEHHAVTRCVRLGTHLVRTRRRLDAHMRLDPRNVVPAEPLLDRLGMWQWRGRRRDAPLGARVGRRGARLGASRFALHPAEQVVEGRPRSTRHHRQRWACVLPSGLAAPRPSVTIQHPRGVRARSFRPSPSTPARTLRATAAPDDGQPGRRDHRDDQPPDHRDRHRAHLSPSRSLFRCIAKTMAFSHLPVLALS